MDPSLYDGGFLFDGGKLRDENLNQDWTFTPEAYFDPHLGAAILGPRALQRLQGNTYRTGPLAPPPRHS